jgi:hypothetical protein
MKKNIITVILLFAAHIPLQAQQSIDELYGDMFYHRRGIHDGNQIRTTFGNDGQIGFRGERAETKDIPGEWPVNSGNVYLSKIVLLPMAEVRVVNGIIQHIVSE